MLFVSSTSEMRLWSNSPANRHMRVSKLRLPVLNSLPSCLLMTSTTPQQAITAQQGRGQQGTGAVIELYVQLRIKSVIGRDVVDSRAAPVLGNPAGDTPPRRQPPADETRLGGLPLHEHEHQLAGAGIGYQQ